MTKQRITPRQAQVVDGVVEGLTNQAIAHRLSITVSTVKIHLRAIFDVTGVSSRLQLAMMFAGKDTSPTPGPLVSPRQREVLRLVALGHTSREIAAQLRVSAKTVAAHRYQLMRKLGLRNSAEAVMYAARNGMVELSVQGGAR